jgi:hypothetical protein
MVLCKQAGFNSGKVMWAVASTKGFHHAKAKFYIGLNSTASKES